MPQKLLYLCLNDGSDTRINKEIKTLAQHFDIYYLGIGQSHERAFVKPICKEFRLIEGHQRDKKTLLKYYFQFTKLFLANHYDNIHVVNELILIGFYPFLWFSKKKIVADIFDSIFLRSSSRIVASMQSLVYALPHKIIVTDDNRKTLVPARFLNKTLVVENYPYRFKETKPKKAKDDELLILYSGSLGLTRGTALLEGMMNASTKVRVWLVGWLYDEPTKTLAQHPQAHYWGVLTQTETMQLASECDYILSVYEPINENNLNASPNKIYDAIQANTPVIINQEVKISQFVSDKNLGYVMPSFYETEGKKLLDTLIENKEMYIFDETLCEKYTWEAVEDKLVGAYGQ